MVEMMVEVVEMMVEEDIPQLYFPYFHFLFLFYLEFSPSFFYFKILEAFTWSKDMEEFLDFEEGMYMWGKYERNRIWKWDNLGVTPKRAKFDVFSETKL